MLQIKSLAKFAMISVALSTAIYGSARATVVTSIKPLGFIAEAIAQGVTPVEVVLPDGASEHEYTLKPSDIRRIQEAELLVWVGPDMEAFITRIANERAASKTLTLTALPQIEKKLITDIDHDDSSNGENSVENLTAESSEFQHSEAAQDISDSHHAHSQYNMHIWLSPKIALASATAIHDRLVKIMPAQKSRLDSNLTNFKANLATTDQRIRAQLAPVASKGYFVFHDAYSYFEQYYGLSPLGHFTVNPEIQPGAQHLHKIRTALVERKAVCVFAEPQFRPALIDAVARGTEVRKGTLDPLGTDIQLSADSYMKFLAQLSEQYASCLIGNHKE